MADTGRPAKFKSVEEIQDKINEYFKKVKDNSDPLTITGLAFHLGFESRQSIYDYEKDGQFSYTIKRARLKIENFAETKLYTTTPTGAIFALKNFGWRDKQELEIKEHNITISRESINADND